MQPGCLEKPTCGNLNCSTLSPNDGDGAEGEEETNVVTPANAHTKSKSNDSEDDSSDDEEDPNNPPSKERERCLQ